MIGSVPKRDTASLNDDEIASCDTDIDIPLTPNVSISAKASCELEGTLSDKDAEFSFDVKLKTVSEFVQSFDYSLAAFGLSNSGYVVNSIDLDSAVDVSLAEGGNRGSIIVEPGVKSFSFTAKVTANKKLSGKEELRLRLKQDGDVLAMGNASLKDQNCEISDQEPDTNPVALYLLMDNSTSMLLPDPSTEEASNANRMEGQARVALYAYQQALADAGYGFSRDDSGQVLSSEDFREALINNSSEELFSSLDDFKVIADPVQAGSQQPMTVHLISYGYAVDYGNVTFEAGDTDDALKAAKAILDVTTPNQRYGNSIKGNSIWKSRDLPKPTANDLYQADGRLTSNLYSGTEMLGALSGLENLLQDQLRRDGNDQPTTLISMVTDGRPERRAWWDTREGPGSDSIIGASISLPDRLGGDAITTSGLIYDRQGNHQLLKDNNGGQPWRSMQRELNAVLDRIAAKGNDPRNTVQVEVMGMGDSTEVDFPAIYGDLFGERTFDNRSGGWSYEYLTSYGLPEFG